MMNEQSIQQRVKTIIKNKARPTRLESWRMKIEMCRRSIDILNFLILVLVRLRFSACYKIGMVKKAQNLPLYIPDRERRILKQTTRIGQYLGLDKGFSRKLMNSLMEESKKLQEVSR